MYHSITFLRVENLEPGTTGIRNTYDYWGLVPSSRPTVAMPVQKTNYLSIPGRNGDIDLSETLTNMPIYENRQGSFEFYVLNDYPLVIDEENPPRFKTWADKYSDLANYFNGETLFFLEDDPAWRYYGRTSFNSWKSEKDHSIVTIDYNLEPFKRRADDQSYDISVAGTEMSFDQNVPYMFALPQFIVNPPSGSAGDEYGITVTYNGVSVYLNTQKGNAQTPFGFIKGGNIKFEISGYADVKITLVGGSL